MQIFLVTFLAKLLLIESTINAADVRLHDPKPLRWMGIARSWPRSLERHNVREYD